VVDWVFSRTAPEGHARPVGRLTRDELERLVLPASEHPLVYVCGANSFVAVVAGWLVELGHAPTRVRTERFGGV
jgi:ferredoxin-NADP reductase